VLVTDIDHILDACQGAGRRQLYYRRGKDATLSTQQSIVFGGPPHSIGSDTLVETENCSTAA